MKAGVRDRGAVCAAMRPVPRPPDVTGHAEGPCRRGNGTNDPGTASSPPPGKAVHRRRSVWHMATALGPPGSACGRSPRASAGATPDTAAPLRPPGSREWTGACAPRCLRARGVCSMYRFNGVDGRLDRILQVAVMIMEAFHGYEDKIYYGITGHSGDEVRALCCGRAPWTVTAFLSG